MSRPGILVQVSRGVYRLAELPEYREPDLSVVCLRYPRAVICLVSALAFHGWRSRPLHRELPCAFIDAACDALFVLAVTVVMGMRARPRR